MIYWRPTTVVEEDGMTDAAIEAIFDQLDRDRHLAGYPLEERASPYFKLFLPEVFKSCFKVSLNPIIIPEFPFRKEADTNRSTKVDFFAVSEDGDGAYLIELKTDMGSLRDEQDEDLESAAQRRVSDILCDVVSIAAAPRVRQDRQKYFHLLHALECLKLIEVDGQLREKIYGDDARGVYDSIRETVVKSIELYPQIVHIIPKPRDNRESKEITFEEVSDAIKNHGPIGKRFSESLTRWATEAAGSPNPGA